MPPGLEQRNQQFIKDLMKLGMNVNTLRQKTKLSAQNQTAGGDIITAADLRFATIDFKKRLGTIPTLARIVTTQICALQYTLEEPESEERPWEEGLFANVPFVVPDENWARVELTPAVLPCILLYYLEAPWRREDAPKTGGTS